MGHDSSNPRGNVVNNHRITIDERQENVGLPDVHIHCCEVPYHADTGFGDAKFTIEEDIEALSRSYFCLRLNEYVEMRA